MIFDEIQAIIELKFALKPTKEQSYAMRAFAEFLLSRDGNSLFLLKGYAGTGKTSLVAAIVKSLVEMKQRVVLLAPTGRAAKVFSLYAEMPAYTIHHRIYRETMGVHIESDAEGGVLASSNSSFSLNPAQLNKDTVFVVDEASMIANEGLSGGMFGSGRLLDDLVHYVYGGQGCRMMLVGDSAQLPPVGEEESPALDEDMLAGYGLTVHKCNLTQVVRQTDESGILWNATSLRKIIQEGWLDGFPRLDVKSFPDVRVVMGDELIESLEDSYYHAGLDETIVVTRSNKRANIFNQGIRGRILTFEEELSCGDQVIVAKNNYYWLDNSDNKEPTKQGASFIANGDVAVVQRFRNERSLYGFRFADVSLTFPDYDDQEVDCTILLDTLLAEAPALTKQQQDQLFNAVWEDYPDITNRRDRMKKLREDIYYNALQVKYAYAVTCHKAQGGQWQRVYIDQGYITEDMLTPDYVRWLYTAITRATEKVYLVNWPKEQCK